MAENNKNNNHYKISDNDAGFEISDEFERFNQINDIFSRAFWDNSVRNDLSDAFFESHRVQPNAKKASGFQQKDFALRNAAWAVSDTFQIEVHMQATGKAFNPGWKMMLR